MSDSLVRRVEEKIRSAGKVGGFQARAAIREVAAWIESELGPGADWVACTLEEEADLYREPISEEENERRFKECMKMIAELKPGDIEKLMGEEFMEEFRRASK